MRYGNIPLSYRPESLVETPTKMQIIRHYPGSDKSKAIPLGQSATKISCILNARTQQQRMLIRQMYHGEQETELYIDNYYYKRVVVSAGFQDRRIKKGMGEITIEFTALDPTPYDVATGEPLY